MPEAVRVRHATIADAPALGRLIGVLGYEVADLAVVERLRALPEGHRVLVAERGAKVVGFAHVAVDPSLLVGWRAQLAGFAVAIEHRGVGVGERLLGAADAWAREHGCTQLWVRSGVAREDAHVFYRAQGFDDVKDQKVFARRLAPAEAATSSGGRVVSTVPHV